MGPDLLLQILGKFTRCFNEILKNLTVFLGYFRNFRRCGNPVYLMHPEIIRFFYDFMRYKNRTLERNGLMMH